MDENGLLHCSPARMDVRELVSSAGKAVLDMMEREWQPLSAGELEHRLDQVVEEVLESDLLTKLQTQPLPTVYVQLLKSKTNPGTQNVSSASVSGNLPEEEAAESHGQQEKVNSAAVQRISDLLQSSKSKARMSGRARLSLSQTVLLALSLLSERISYRSVSKRFQLEKGNIHRIFFSFCERINMLQEQQIRWPVGTEALSALFPFSSHLGKDERKEEQGVPQILGVLGHTRIPIRLPVGRPDSESEAPVKKKTKKEDHPDFWLNLELVCSRGGQFLHWRISKGSDLDRGRTLGDRLKQHPELIPSDSCLVARPGYPLTEQILTPYRRSCGPKEDLFNRTLEEHCQILDRAVASLKARFKRLTYLDIGNYERARAVVLTACVLHNVFVNLGQVLEEESEKENAVVEEEDGEEDDEGVRRRDTVAGLLLKGCDFLSAGRTEPE
uniref:Transcription elongation factor B (SIII), polypeptide 2 (18kD, elongin B) n=2 Tax=Iconisemion striatum TaxID=60296 RepID=A0A1A7WBX4_9TELE